MENLLNVREERRENRWLELTSFIQEEIYWGNDIGFSSLNSYKKNAFEEETIIYGFGEDGIWENLFKVSDTKDYDDLHRKFKNSKWCEGENLMVFELMDGAKYCALKV